MSDHTKNKATPAWGVGLETIIQAGSDSEGGHSPRQNNPWTELRRNHVLDQRLLTYLYRPWESLSPQEQGEVVYCLINKVSSKVFRNFRQHTSLDILDFLHDIWVNECNKILKNYDPTRPLLPYVRRMVAFRVQRWITAQFRHEANRLHEELLGEVDDFFIEESLDPDFENGVQLLAEVDQWIASHERHGAIIVAYRNKKIGRAQAAQQAGITSNGFTRAVLRAYERARIEFATWLDDGPYTIPPQVCGLTYGVKETPDGFAAFRRLLKEADGKEEILSLHRTEQDAEHEIRRWLTGGGNGGGSLAT